ncbi:MAG: cyclic nucleotide-binding domain-containing protein [Candidatus Latescibacteria bacterium]|nr:cyclic nucleotide-binding domain-containing protein [Candidatus Latescibacterota bacterium]
MHTHRRSGLDRRKLSLQSDERRKTKDRRELLQDFDHTYPMYQRIPIFSDLTKDQLASIIRICTKKKHEEKQKIFDIGEDPSYMTILLEGEIILKFISGVKWQSITPPATVGEMEFFTGKNRCSSVVTETDCTVLNINGKEFFSLLNKNADLGNGIYLNVIKDLSSKLQNANEKIDELYGGLFRCTENTYH